MVFLLLLLQLFESFWVGFDLTFNGLDVLLRASVLKPDEGEDFTHSAERVDLTDIVSRSFQEIFGNFLDLPLLLVGVLGVVDTATVLKRVVHGQFLFQVADLLLVAFDEECGVEHRVNAGFVGDLHHAGRKLER